MLIVKLSLNQNFFLIEPPSIALNKNSINSIFIKVRNIYCQIIYELTFINFKYCN